MDKKKPKRKNSPKDFEKPTKDETSVAKYLKFNAQTKPGKFMGNDVQYFIGSKIVDFLMESKWSNKNPKSKSILFTSRNSCVTFCQQLLEKGFFHRVCKPERREKKVKNKDITDELTVNKRKAKKDIQPSTDIKKNSTDEAKVDKLETKEDEDKKKKKKKQKLEMHEQQLFKDGPDLYIWIYDPVSMKTFVIGLLLVIGSIGVCLFPLWPPEVKVGIYYLSMVAAGFIGLILVLCIVRMILFVLIWLFTVGKISFWLLPNLTEDVGFFESFTPLYKVDYKQIDSDGKEKSEKGKNKKSNDNNTVDNNVGDIIHTNNAGYIESTQIDVIKNDPKSKEFDNDDDDEENYDDNDVDNENDNDDLGIDEYKGDNNGDNGDSSNGYELLDVDDYDDDVNCDDNSDSNSGDDNKKMK